MKKNLNKVIKNLSEVNNANKQNQETKDDLVKMIFITSEAMRFQCDKKTLEIFAQFTNDKKLTLKEIENLKQEIKITEENFKTFKSQLPKKCKVNVLIKNKKWDEIKIKIQNKEITDKDIIQILNNLMTIDKTINEKQEIINIDELKTIISDSKNILKDIQEKIFNTNQTINWADYTSQLRGNWRKYSEVLNKFRNKIIDSIIEVNKVITFIEKNKNNINKIMETNNNKIIELISKSVDFLTNKEHKKQGLKKEIIQLIRFSFKTIYEWKEPLTEEANLINEDTKDFDEWLKNINFEEQMEKEKKKV